MVAGAVERPLLNRWALQESKQPRQGDPPMARKHDRFDHLTMTDLQLIARTRGITVPEDADRSALVALLRDGETLDGTPRENVVARRFRLVRRSSG